MAGRMRNLPGRRVRCGANARMKVDVAADQPRLYRLPRERTSDHVAAPRSGPVVILLHVPPPPPRRNAVTPTLPQLLRFRGLVASIPLVPMQFDICFDVRSRCMPTMPCRSRRQASDSVGSAGCRSGTGFSATALPPPPSTEPGGRVACGGLASSQFATAWELRASEAVAMRPGRACGVECTDHQSSQPRAPVVEHQASAPDSANRNGAAAR
ncbi:hypothetical protein BKA25_001444 [Actinoalloteichus hymeniacidonis]|uniref:Uncharacterized protein n=1 Tax=Actinoalloteichus hymeniacidonis TaxID=340345 RepID=A0AAC9MYW4_9PSEU|nr:hypothetical protein TL08_20035 [Actinoalloteichus hymeniacidonis]MBB5907128.1 hypothetical protein [Actinoalloteichus hymeniacidonis]